MGYSRAFTAASGVGPTTSAKTVVATAATTLNNVGLGIIAGAAVYGLFRLFAPATQEEDPT